MDTALAVVVLLLAILAAYYFATKLGGAAPQSPCAAAVTVHSGVDCISDGSGGALQLTYIGSDGTTGAWPAVQSDSGTKGVTMGTNKTEDPTLADCIASCQANPGGCALLVFDDAPTDPSGKPLKRTCRYLTPAQLAGTGFNYMANAKQPWTAVYYPNAQTPSS